MPLFCQYFHLFLQSYNIYISISIVQPTLRISERPTCQHGFQDIFRAINNVDCKASTICAKIWSVKKFFWQICQKKGGHFMKKKTDDPSRATADSLWKRCFQCKELFLFLLPAILLILVFNYFPMYGILMAFQNFVPSKGIWGSSFVGLQQFERFFSLPTFGSLIGNTVKISLLSLAVNFPIPILLALLLNQIRGERTKKAAQTFVYMPHFISVVVAVGMINVLLSPTGGIYGGVCKALGIKAVNLFSKPGAFQWIYVLSDTWQHAGWNSIIYLAALSSVDPSLYEAATVDGANRLQKIFHIDIPALIPTMVILLILNTGNVLSVGFEKIFLMQNSANIGVSEVISTYVYKIGLKSAQYSFSAAVGLFNTLINFVVLLLVNQISKKVADTSLW